jgi:hypothetical protein
LTLLTKKKKSASIPGRIRIKDFCKKILLMNQSLSNKKRTGFLSAKRLMRQIMLEDTTVEHLPEVLSSLVHIMILLCHI